MQSESGRRGSFRKYPKGEQGDLAVSGLRYPVWIPIEVALLLIVIGGGCQSSGNNAPSSSAARLPVVPAGFIATPTGALKACEHIEILRSGCPRIVPRAAYRNPGGSVKLYTFFALPARHGFPPTFSVQWYAESPNHPRLNHPPRFIHIVLYAAHGSVTRFPHAFLSGWPTAAGRIADGDVAELTRAGLALGHVRWNGRRGSLALIPPYGYGGMQGGHLVVRWCSAGTDFALGLHAWEPFTETVAELKTIVESLPPASASQGTCSGPGGGYLEHIHEFGSKRAASSVLSDDGGVAEFRSSRLGRCATRGLRGIVLLEEALMRATLSRASQ